MELLETLEQQVAYVLACWIEHAQASAQRLPQQESLSLSAAIEEARRSPFHAHDGVNRSADAQFAARTDPAALFSWGGSAHPAAQETGGDPQAAAGRGRNDTLWYTRHDIL